MSSCVPFGVLVRYVRSNPHTRRAKHENVDETLFPFRLVFKAAMERRIRLFLLLLLAAAVVAVSPFRDKGGGPDHSSDGDTHVYLRATGAELHAHVLQVRHTFL